MLVIDDGRLIEQGNHASLLAQKGFYYNLYMSQFKGTIDEADFEYIKPAEVYDKPQQISMPRRGMGGGMDSGPSPEIMRKRAMEVIKIFKENEAISPESAKNNAEYAPFISFINFLHAVVMFFTFTSFLNKLSANNRSNHCTSQSVLGFLFVFFDNSFPLYILPL